MREKGKKWNEIANELNRTITSCKLKYNRTRMKDGEFNKCLLEKKYDFNKQFVDELKPKSLLDVYAGKKSSYYGFNNLKVTSNDILESEYNTYNLDALICLCKLYSEGKKFDIVDLDPHGSAYDCFDLAIRMAKKGLIITFGELGHKRWKRYDYVSRHYGIETDDDFTLNNLINEVVKIGVRNKKKLTPFLIEENHSIARVYFKISKEFIGYDFRK